MTSNPALHRIHPQLLHQMNLAQITLNTSRQLLFDSIIFEKKILSETNPNPNFYQNEQLIFGAWISISFFTCFSIIGFFLVWKRGISRVLNSHWTTIYISALSFLLGVFYAGVRIYLDPFYLDKPIFQAISNLQKNAIREN